MAENRKSVVILGGVFVCALATLGLIYSHLPEVATEHKTLIKLPRNIEDAKVCKTAHINYTQLLSLQ